MGGNGGKAWSVLFRLIWYLREIVWKMLTAKMRRESSRNTEKGVTLERGREPAQHSLGRAAARDQCIMRGRHWLRVRTIRKAVLSVYYSPARLVSVPVPNTTATRRVDLKRAKKMMGRMPVSWAFTEGDAAIPSGKGIKCAVR